MSTELLAKDGVYLTEISWQAFSRAMATRFHSKPV